MVAKKTAKKVAKKTAKKVAKKAPAKKAARRPGRKASLLSDTFRDLAEDMREDSLDDFDEAPEDGEEFFGLFDGGMRSRSQPVAECAHTWKDATGKIWLIRDMEDSHLRNAVRFVIRRGVIFTNQSRFLELIRELTRRNPEMTIGDLVQ